MVQQSDMEIAERLQRRRARLVILLAVMFVAGQAVYFGNMQDPERLVDQVRVSAWFVWALALLLLLATGGGLFRSASVRALLNDEGTRAHRASALAFGFWAAMAGCILLYIVTMFEAVGAREAVHIVLSFGIGAALLRFGMLERRSLRGI